jgi:hypothetical protein
LQLDRLHRQRREQRDHHQCGAIQFGNDTGLTDAIMFPFTLEEGSENQDGSFASSSRETQMLPFRRMSQASCGDLFDDSFHTPIPRRRGLSDAMARTPRNPRLAIYDSESLFDAHGSYPPAFYPPFSEDSRQLNSLERPTPGDRFILKIPSTDQLNDHALPDSNNFKRTPFRHITLPPKWSHSLVQDRHSDLLPSPTVGLADQDNSATQDGPDFFVDKVESSTATICDTVSCSTPDTSFSLWESTGYDYEEDDAIDEQDIMSQGHESTFVLASNGHLLNTTSWFACSASTNPPTADATSPLPLMATPPERATNDIKPASISIMIPTLSR